MVKAAVRFGAFLVSVSVFTAFCALGLCMATERLLPGGVMPLFSGLHLAVFGSTLVIYNLPRLVPRPYNIPRPAQELRPWYYVFFLSGIFIMSWGVYTLPLGVKLISAILGVFAVSYFMPTLPLPEKKRLRDHGLLKILVLTAVWTAATAILPIMDEGARVIDYPFELVLRFVFVFALCILFDIRDMQVDSSKNIITLPNKIGVESAYDLVHLSLLLFIILSMVQHLRHPSAGRLFAAVLTSGVTALVARYVRRHPGHKAFVAMTDGMMLLYAVLILLME
jgi:4-hydroxybenzoate polyprenyltransferase